MIDIHDDVWTISTEMRNDIKNHFKSSASTTSIVEIGAYKGYTTKFLSQIFHTVYAVDNHKKWLQENKNYNSDSTNIVFVELNLYRDDWNILQDPNVEVVFIDAVHSYYKCKSDTINSLKTFQNLKYIIFDDYGVFPEVKKVVDEFVENQTLSVVSFLGLTSVPTLSGVNVENTHEGILCKVNQIP